MLLCPSRSLIKDIGAPALSISTAQVCRVACTRLSFRYFSQTAAMACVPIGLPLLNLEQESHTGASALHSLPYTSRRYSISTWATCTSILSCMVLLPLQRGQLTIIVDPVMEISPHFILHTSLTRLPVFSKMDSKA